MVHSKYIQSTSEYSKFVSKMSSEWFSQIPYMDANFVLSIIYRKDVYVV